MNYIVFDLEWNQSNTGKEPEAESLPFEIIEIGAVKINDDCVITDSFQCLIRPRVYREMHRITGELLHLQMEELENGKPFSEAAAEFLAWCGREEAIFCTWGSLDLTELQRNMKFYNMTRLSEGPIAFLDVQKLFSIAYEDRKSRRALEYAIDFLQIPKEIPFHRAYSDAYYTAKILGEIMRKDREILKNVSYDAYYPPSTRDKEIKTQFDTYMKYISRQFDTREEAFEDREVVSSKCYLCHRNLRKKIKWFSVNGRHYYCVAYCEAHGYLKGKIRVRRTDEGKIYIVKTTKFISREEAEAIAQRRDHARELRKRHRAATRGSGAQKVPGQKSEKNRDYDV